MASGSKDWIRGQQDSAGHDKMDWLPGLSRSCDGPLGQGQLKDNGSDTPVFHGPALLEYLGKR